MCARSTLVKEMERRNEERELEKNGPEKRTSSKNSIIIKCMTFLFRYVCMCLDVIIVVASMNFQYSHLLLSLNTIAMTVTTN